MGNPATRIGTMNPTVLQHWQHSLAMLIVSEERARWIQERYPPTDSGRPGILHCEPQRKTSRAKDAQNGRKMDEAAEVAEVA